MAYSNRRFCFPILVSIGEDKKRSLRSAPRSFRPNHRSCVTATAPPARERGAAAGAAAPVRLFVGGVAAGVTPAELAERFAPFGQVAGVQLVAGKAPGGGRDPTRGTAYVDLLLRAEERDKDLQRCISLYNGCTWRGSRLRVERAVEHYTSRLRREEQAAAAAAAARSAAAEAAAQQAAAAATPEAQAAARLTLTQKLRESTLLIQSRCPSKFIKVHACGGRNAGRHKKSFQRLPGTDGAPPARAAALSASELRTALVASPPPAAAKRPPPASPATAPPAKASRVAPPAQDAWSRLFRRAAGVEAVEDVSDAEEPPPEEPEQEAPAAELQRAPPPVAPPPPLAPPVAAAVKAPSRAAAAPPRARAEMPAPPLPPAEPRAPLTEAEVETALEAERETQRRVLASMGIVFDPAPALSRPAPMPATSSDDDDAHDHLSFDAPGRFAHEPVAASPESLSDVSEDEAAPARGARALVSQDQSAWARALRQAAGEDDQQTADATPADAPAVTGAPAAGRKAAAREAAARLRKKKAPPAAPPAERKGIAAALERTRLGEGRQGVYFADAAFDWRDLAVNPAQQTWTLLGGGGGAGASGDAPHDAAAHADDAPSAPKPLAAAMPQRAPASAPLAAVNLHTLGASFMRSEADDSLRSAWEANREALAVDFKSKRRQALRGSRPGKTMPRR